MDDPLPISALNNFAFCPRRCALIHTEGVWSDNAHTVQGTIAHERADSVGYETAKGTTALRGLVLFSHRHGLSGRADIVEVSGGVHAPVEYKKGKRRHFDNDDVQLCAQGLCLEEMFACRVPRGFVFHAASKRRREVEFNELLRSETLRIVGVVRALLASTRVPPARLLPRCDGCSLRGVCLPELTDETLGTRDTAAQELFG